MRLVGKTTHSSHVRPWTDCSSSAVRRLPDVKYPEHVLVSQQQGSQGTSSWFLPAVIFASISTLESAGISSSGNSTRSRIGMLMIWLTLKTDSRSPSNEHSSWTYPWPTMASCFMLHVLLISRSSLWDQKKHALAHAQHPVDFLDA